MSYSSLQKYLTINYTEKLTLYANEGILIFNEEEQIS